MADVKISALPSGTAATSDEVPVNQAGTTKKVTVQTIVDLATAASPAVQLSWKFDTSTTMSAPSNKYFRMNNATPASVTQIAVDDNAFSGVDASNIFGILASGNKIYIQQQDDATKYILFSVTSAADQTGWWLITVTVDSSGTLFGNNKECTWIMFASGASYTDENAQDAIGTILVDSSSVDFTYNDGTPSITAAVLPAGVDHNSLLNYSANNHVPSMTAGSVAFHNGTILSQDNATFFWDSTNKRLGLGVGAASNTLTINGTTYGAVLTTGADGTSDVLLSALHRHSSSAAIGAFLTLARSRGASGSETVVSNGDAIGAIYFAGHDGTDYAYAAGIAVSVSGTPGSNDMPSQMIFQTVPDGSQTLTTAMTISNTQVVTFANHPAGLVIVNADVSASAAIALTKLAATTASRALVSDASGFVTAATTTSTEIGYVNGVTSAIQTQLNNKQGLDATLTALAAYNTNGILTQTAADTFTGRTLVDGATSGLDITNGDGVSGNPTFQVNLSKFTADTIVTSDYLAFYDVSGSDTNKVLVSDFVTAINGSISHASTTNLAWTSSGHTGTASNLAGWNGSNAATVYTLSGTGTQIPTTVGPTFTGGITTDQIKLSGNISSTAWTTNGIRIKGIPATLTDTSSSGTVATAYTDVFGGNTIAVNTNTTFTNYITAFFKEPIAGTTPATTTFTNKWALGAESLRVGTSNQMTVSTSGLLSVNAVTMTSSIDRGIAFDATGQRLRLSGGLGLVTVNDSVTVSGGPITQVSIDTFDALTVTASTALTITNLIGVICRLPITGSGVTVTNPTFALGAESFVVGTAAMANLDFTLAGTSTKPGIYTSQNSNNSPGGMTFLRSSATLTHTPELILGKSKNTTASRTVVATGDYLGRISFVGYDGTDFGYGAQIRCLVTETTPTGGAMGSKIEFLTSPAGSETPAVAMSIASDKTVNFVVNPTGLVTTSVDNTIPRFDGTGGKLQTSNITIGDSDDIDLVNTIKLVGVASNTGTANNNGMVEVSNSRTWGYTSGSNYIKPAVRFAGTQTFSVDSYALSAGFLFDVTPSITNSVGANRNISSFYTVNSQPAFNADTNTVTQGFQISYVSAPAFTRTNSGAWNCTALTQFSSGGSVGAGCTVTAGIGFSAGSMANSGTLTGQAGFASTMTTGTNYTQYLCGTTTIPSGTWNIYQSDSLANRWNGAQTYALNRTGSSLDLSSGTNGASNHFIYGTAAGATTHTLPAGASTIKGRAYYYYNSGAGTMTIARNGSTIAGAASDITLVGAGTKAILVYDGTGDWARFV